MLQRYLKPLWKVHCTIQKQNIFLIKSIHVLVNAFSFQAINLILAAKYAQMIELSDYLWYI